MSAGTRGAPLTVLAPLDGRLTSLADVPDPVFAGQVVGAGAAIEPPEDTAVVVVAPLSGRLAKVHPHAFVVAGASGAGVLVHLGIDTVRMGGAGFTLHVQQGDDVEAGAPVVTFDAVAVRDAGLSASCPVVLLQSPADSASPLGPPGAQVRRGEPFLAFAAPG